MDRQDIKERIATGCALAIKTLVYGSAVVMLPVVVAGLVAVWNPQLAPATAFFGMLFMFGLSALIWLSKPRRFRT